MIDGSLDQGTGDKVKNIWVQLIWKVEPTVFTMG